MLKPRSTKFFHKSLLLRGALFLLLNLTSCSSSSNPPPERPYPVKVGVVLQHDVPVYIEAIGNVAASNSVDIRPQVGGTIIDVRIEGGDDVKVGDILYRIDPIVYQLALEKAQATLEKDQAELQYAKTKVDRYANLVQKDYVSKLNIEEYRRDVSTLEAQILIDQSDIGVAKNNLNYCVIISPIEGRVNLNKIDIGNVVSPTDTNPMTTILQIAPVYINFSIAQRDFETFQSVLAQGNRKLIVILPGTEKEFEGEVLALNNQVNLRTGTLQIRGSVPNHNKILWPGEFVKVRLFIRTLKQAALVPLEAVQIGQKGSYVFVLKPDDTVESVLVKTGEHFGDSVVVEEGLKPEMKIITEGQINLRAGVKVLIINKEEKTSPLASEPKL